MQWTRFTDVSLQSKDGMQGALRHRPIPLQVGTESGRSFYRGLPCVQQETSSFPLHPACRVTREEAVCRVDLWNSVFIYVHW